VVIPLDKLGDYSHGIERINIRLSIENKLATLGAIKDYFHSIDANTSLVKDKINHTLSLLDKVESAWQDALTSLEQEAGFKALQTSERVISYVADFILPRAFNLIKQR
jgi:hypothetical protein